MTTEDLIECAKYKGHEPELSLVIYKDINTGTFVKKCIYKDEIEFLQIGEYTHSKRLDKLDRYFPLVFFDALEAKKYGFQINCNHTLNLFSYRGMTCDPESLNLIKEIEFVEAMGNSVKITINKCSKCGEFYKIREEYDSHHGINRICIKPNSEMKLDFGKVLKFEFSEIK